MSVSTFQFPAPINNMSRVITRIAHPRQACCRYTRQFSDTSQLLKVSKFLEFSRVKETLQRCLSGGVSAVVPLQRLHTLKILCQFYQNVHNSVLTWRIHLRFSGLVFTPLRTFSQNFKALYLFYQGNIYCIKPIWIAINTNENSPCGAQIQLLLSVTSAKTL